MAYDYLQIIDELTKTMLGKSIDFFELVSDMKGIHPIDILKSVHRLYNNGHVSRKILEEVILSAKLQNAVEEDNSFNTLPVPHLVDYDWRFSKKGVLLFTHKIETAIEAGIAKAIVFIGAPSLFRYYFKNQIDNVDFYLIDFNANIHVKDLKLNKNYHVIDCNVHYDLPNDLTVESIKADMVIIDPPWYHEYYKRFFDICNSICGVGCVVLGSYPPELTRSSIVEETYNLESYVQALGFDKLRFEYHCIEYSTPPFEKNVLKVNQIENYPPNWRYGDLILTKRVFNGPKEIINYPFFTSSGGWSEIQIDIMRVKYKQNVVTYDNLFNIEMNHLYPNDIYPSVSRRYQGSKDINVWTSGNRVFNCNNISLLIYILENIDDTDIVYSIEKEYGIFIERNQRRQILDVQNLMQHVILLEKQEYGRWA